MPSSLRANAKDLSVRNQVSPRHPGIGCRLNRVINPPVVDERPLRVEERPLDATLRSTDELPPTPQRDRRIPSTAWIQAPDALHELGADIGWPEVIYLRMIGTRWLLFRAGPAVDANARYGAIDLMNFPKLLTFDLGPDGNGTGIGADAKTHDRFRTWKESLRDA